MKIIVTKSLPEVVKHTGTVLLELEMARKIFSTDTQVHVHINDETGNKRKREGGRGEIGNEGEREGGK